MSTTCLLEIGNGPMAMVLHPTWMKRDDPNRMAEILNHVDMTLSECSREVRLVVTGGGFLEVNLTRAIPSREARSVECLEDLILRVREAEMPLALLMEVGGRDYLVGVDVISNGCGVGQFMVLLSSRDVSQIVWKSFPVGVESEWLAGFGTERGRACPRVMNTKLGTTLALVCHDVQAYNHRNRALVGRALSRTHRGFVIDEMTKGLHAAKPNWAVNAVHQIAKTESIKTFATSYKQLSEDYDWHPRVVGAFGYDHGVEDMLPALSLKSQYPPGSAAYAVVLKA